MSCAVNFIFDELKKQNVIKKGHFLLTSGRHSDAYINKDEIFLYPNLLSRIVSGLAQKLLEYKITHSDIITGPAVAGALIASTVAKYLGVPFVYPEKIEGKMVFRRGFGGFIKGKSVFVVEDIITTGKSLEQTIDAVTLNGGYVKGSVCIWNREYYSDTSVLSLCSKKVESYIPDNCPQCKENVPLIDIKQSDTTKQIRSFEDVLIEYKEKNKQHEELNKAISILEEDAEGKDDNYYSSFAIDILYREKEVLDTEIYKIETLKVS